MSCGNFFYYATCHNLGPSLTIIMDDVNQYFDFFNVQKSSQCHMLELNRWMKINDVNMKHECNHKTIPQ